MSAIRWNRTARSAAPGASAPDFKGSLPCEGFFAKLAKRRLKRGATINRFVAETNLDPKPFTWTADLDKIIAAVRRGHQALNSIHLSSVLGYGRRLPKAAARAQNAPAD